VNSRSVDGTVLFCGRRVDRSAAIVRSIVAHPVASVVPIAKKKPARLGGGFLVRVMQERIRQQ
jgi:hypothetical protein